jgi:hypothetical protein
MKILFILISAVICASCAHRPLPEALNTPALPIIPISEYRILDGETETIRRTPPYENISDNMFSHSGLDAADSRAKRRADAISEAVSAIDGIESASVTVMQTSAIIGISIEGTPTDDEIVEYKKQARRAALRADTGLVRISVTAQKELIERVQKLSEYGNGDIELSEHAEDVIGGLTPTN